MAVTVVCPVYLNLIRRILACGKERRWWRRRNRSSVNSNRLCLETHELSSKQQCLFQDFVGVFRNSDWFLSYIWKLCRRGQRLRAMSVCFVGSI